MDVLIVEDEQNLRESLVEGLAAAFDDLSIGGAESAEEARELIASRVPRLVISDVRLPGEDGVSLLLHVREHEPGTQFIFVSAYPSPEAHEQARERGLRFLRKPFELSQLLEAVEEALEQSEFSGQVGGISLVDLLQLLNMGGRTAAVTVRQGARAGTMFFSGGEVVHAVAGDVRGREAFDRIMTWKSGRFAMEPGREPPEVTIHEPLNGLLLDVFRRQDEERRGDAESDVLDGLFAEEPDAPGSTEGERESSRPLLEEGMTRLPGSLATAEVDLKTERLTGVSPPDALSEEILALLPAATVGWFGQPALIALDRALARTPGADAPDAESHLLEIIAISPDVTHLLQRVREPRDTILAAVCPTSERLGPLVARARSWRRTASGRRRG